jgi:predicted transcriptional regulator
MKHITITVDDELAERIAAYEAAHDTSVSTLVSEYLQSRLTRRADYEAAMKRFLEQEPVDLGGAPYPTRDEIHDRSRFR